MPELAPPGQQPKPSRSLRPIYLAVVIVEALVLTGLWLFSRHFG